MKRQKVVRAATSKPKRVVIRASISTTDMLNAFEDKLAELEVESSTNIQASSAEEVATRDFIREMARDDYEYGSVFDRDDYEEFAHVVKDDGYIVDESDFDFYFDCVDECQEDIESCTEIKASEEVDIYGEDYNDRYQDVGGGFGDTGVIYSLAEIKEMWNADHNSDPSMSPFSSFDSWWNSTRNNFMIEA